MFGLRSALVLALCAISASAAPSSQILVKRQDAGAVNSVTCGSNTYTSDQLAAATAEGCRLNAAGQAVGRNSYPHTFNNREQLDFSVDGPYQEFPILSSGTVYTGRSPGADRIVFNPDLNGQCTYVGAMTHTGAPGRNGFVLCDSN